MFIVSEILDVATFVVTGITYVFKTIYDYFFAGIINRFVGDVKEKIKAEETREKHPHAKQEKDSAITPDKLPGQPSTGLPSAQIGTPLQPTQAPSMPTPSNMPAPSQSTPQSSGMPGMPMA